MACNFFDIDLEIYMVKVSYQQKPYRRIIMENFGASVYASPTDRTHAGRAALEQDPNNPGSLGLATPALARFARKRGTRVSEAVEVAATSGGAKKYSLGSVLNHVPTEGPDGHRRRSADADTCTWRTQPRSTLGGECRCDASAEGDGVPVGKRQNSEGRKQKAESGATHRGGGRRRCFA